MREVWGDTLPAVCNTVNIACVLSASQAEPSWQHDSGNKLVRESERKGKLNAMKSEPRTSYILHLTSDSDNLNVWLTCGLAHYTLGVRIIVESRGINHAWMSSRRIHSVKFCLIGNCHGCICIELDWRMAVEGHCWDGLQTITVRGKQ